MSQGIRIAYICFSNIALMLLAVWIFSIITCSMIAIPAVASESPTWQPAGIGGGGTFLSVHVDPKLVGVVYATGDVGGIYRSMDFGAHWEMRNVGLGNYQVSSFAIDPFDSDTLYAGAGALAESNKAGMYVSHDAGLSWHHLPATAEKGITFRQYRTRQAIALDPARPGVIVSGSRGNGLWRSADGGQSWSQVFKAPLISVPLYFPSATKYFADDPKEAPYNAPVSTVIFDPAANGVVYAALYGVGVLRSDDGGVAGSWRSISDGLPQAPTVLHLVVGADKTLYAALGAAGVFRSDDGGNRWRPVNDDLPLHDFRVVAVAAHPFDSNIAYLTQRHVRRPEHYYAAVWKTEDGGASWAETGKIEMVIAQNPAFVWAYRPASGNQLVLDPNEPDRVYFTDPNGIYRTEDGGRSWQSAVAGAQITCVADIYVSRDLRPDKQDTLYAAHPDMGLLSTTDRGNTWVSLRPNGTGNRRQLAGHYWSFAMGRYGGRHYYYTAMKPWGRRFNLVLRSTDGREWEIVHNEPMSGGGLGKIILAIDPAGLSALYLVQERGQVMISVDRGETWVPTPSQPDIDRFNDLVVDTKERIVAASFLDGVWYSRDAGISWRKSNGVPSRVWDLATDKAAIYAAGGDGNLYRSRDGGATWRKATDFPRENDPDRTGTEGTAVGVDPDNSDHIVFARADTWHFVDAGSGVVESWDGGLTWESINRGLGHRRVFAFAFGSDGTLYAGTWCGGMWRRSPATERQPK